MLGKPELARRGLGSFSVLTEIAWALETGRRYHYLGYWIADCRKMAYKTRFRPCELLGTDGVWREAGSGEAQERSRSA